MSHKTYNLFFGAMILISSIAPSSAQEASLSKLLRQARAAIASDSRLKEVKSFSAVFNIRHVLFRGDQASGEVRLDFLLSDKLLKNETWDLPGNVGQVISSFLLNGEQTWSDVHTTSSKIPILRDDSVNAENERTALFQSLRKENAFYLLQLLLMAPSYAPVEFVYAGEAQAEDGRADVLDVKGLSDFTVRLYFDKESHQLLMMSYQEPASQGVLFARGRAGNRSTKPGETPKEQSTEVKLHFSDYRAEDGIVVPHLITEDRDGKTIEEKKLKSFKINPAFKPGHFEIKRKS